MKRTIKSGVLLFLGLIISLTLNFGIAYAQKPDRTIEVNMGIMDDFGNILVDYSKETFEIKDDHFVYRKPPLIDRYTFATANVLKLVTDNGETFRVNYFYTLDSTEAGDLPEPLLWSEMPMKKAPIEKIKVAVSWTDESMREISNTKIMKLNYFWDAFEIPSPKQLAEYGFLRLETGRKMVAGESMFQLVYIYKRRGSDEKAPSLIFAHLFGNQLIKTIKPEYLPPQSTAPVTKADPKPSTSPIPKPDREPVTTKDPTGTTATTNPAETTHTETSSVAGSTTPRQTQGELNPLNQRPAQGLWLAGLMVVIVGVIYSKRQRLK